MADTQVAAKDYSFPQMLHSFKMQVASALPKHLNADRMCRVALSCFRATPALQKCDPASIFASVVILAQQGLEPGLNGRAYLVPYFNTKKNRHECEAIPGWKGLVELANRTGRCAVWTGAVFSGDTFEFGLGDSPFCRHVPGGEDDPDKLLFTYAVGRIKGNDFPVIEVWPNAKIKRHFRRYNKVGDKHYAYGNWEMYARKVPLMQVLKYMPASPELEAAMTLSDSGEHGAQNLDIKEAIDGTFAPTFDEEGDETGSGSGAIDGINAEAQKNGNGTTSTKRVSDSGAPSLEYVLGQIKVAREAKDAGKLDEAADLVRSIADEGQRAEADVAERAARKAIA